MGKIAFLFAGQGAQYSGMGKSLYEGSGAAKRLMDEAESVRKGTLADCFEADAERLSQTEVTQPCVFTVDLAAALALKEAGIAPEGVAGFSLGEMAALSFAGAFTHKKGFELVCERARLMKNAAEQNPGAMAAVLKLSDEDVQAICARFSQVYPVNYNCKGQLVVAAAKEELAAFCDEVKAAKGLAKPLAVSGGFHSPFMSEAADAFEQVLSDSGMSAPEMPVYANLTAKPYEENALAKTLAMQIQSPVLWSRTILNMQEDGFDTFVEVGPGKTLIGLVKRIAPSAKLLNVQTAEDVQNAVKELL